MCTYFGFIRLIIILLTSICLQDVQAIRESYQVVDRCPYNESGWMDRAAHIRCNGSESYHCLLTEGGVSLREQCTETSLFTNGFCPIFTNEGYLQWSACKDTACPTSSYRSDEVYQYQICYRKSDKPKRKNTEQRPNNSGADTNVTTLVIIVAILSFLVLLSIMVVFYKRNQCGFKDKVHKRCPDIEIGEPSNQTQPPIKDIEIGEPPEQTRPLIKDIEIGEPPEQTRPLIKDIEIVEPSEQAQALMKGDYDDWDQKIKKLEELLKYLVHILKRELSVNDLKEKMVIHSKSIEQYFSEPLIKEFQNVKNPGDYSRLDISLVFTLLRNFCEDIKPSSRGWDYEPPDDETHVGADIERIRFMWNKYCDDDLEFEHLDEVYNRIKQTYGTVIHPENGVSQHPNTEKENNDGFESVKEKIPGIRLNPDCVVEEGIVITNDIKTILKSLESRNVIILKGMIGCGKTHALKAIQNNFHEKEWETAWVESEIVEGEISYEKPTILLCDNLFGKFGSSVFSQDAVDKIEKVLEKIERSKLKIKVVIGIHAHVFDEVKTNLDLNFLLKKNITVEMNNLSEAETLLIFKEQLKKGHCEMDSNCWFKTVEFQSVLDKLSKNQGTIGGPFLSLMYCIHHELFSDEFFPVDPVHTMVKFFKKCWQNSPSLYARLLYLTCIQEHSNKEDLEQWVRDVSTDLPLHAGEKMTISSPFEYIQVVDSKFTLRIAHELFSIILFKSVAETTVQSELNVLLKLIQRCKDDIIVQLLRPVDNKQSDISCEFVDVSKSILHRKVGKICVYRLTCKYKISDADADHPLMTIDFVKEKYPKYWDNPPVLDTWSNMPKYAWKILGYEV